ncbi:DNA/RNA nuclease SfsA [Halobacteriovorax sp. JY17]|uniref:DNA/RNA nuclease SfsA n=1 Tax=Halobacteriovorax sp. JY17 TaxID=2014617 RepID=UPI000C4DF254|nr:DNA/RNA nuclease SfsA [Halobacteriovorax sp. JY17]PIK13721.1 MAG: DNA/RNA nuclease SfsA [Halobacteriovorax sp. JY17]
MKYNSPTFKGKILKRYKRFLADIVLEQDTPINKKGDIIVAHTANTGSMKTCWGEGWDVLLSYHDNPKRKLKYSLELTHNSKTWIGVNTSLPNKLAVESIENGIIKELQGYETIKPEEKIGKSRIDLYLYSGEKTAPTDQCFVEIKNVTLLGDDQLALFPDSVSERGQKHLLELIELKEQGIRACMLYIVQREDVNLFSPASLIDPKYSELLKLAHAKGVEILVYQCKLSELGVDISHPLDFKL